MRGLYWTVPNTIHSNEEKNPLLQSHQRCPSFSFTVRHTHTASKRPPPPHAHSPRRDLCHPTHKCCCRYSEQLAKDLPEADLVVGFEQYGNLSTALRESLGLGQLDADKYLQRSRVQVWT